MNNIESLLGQYRDFSDEYSTAKAHLSYLEEFKKSKIAMLMKAAQKLGISRRTLHRRLHEFGLEEL